MMRRIALAAIVALLVAYAPQPVAAEPPALTIVDLGITSFGIDYKLSDGGQVAITASGGLEARTFLWDAGVLTDVGNLGQTFTWVRDVNTRGQVVGLSMTKSGETHAFLWEHGVMTDLGTLGGTSSVAVAINDAGQIVGASGTESGETHAFLWEHGVMGDLGTLGGTYTNSTAQDINERGEIVGRSAESDYGPYHAVLWTGNGRASVVP